MVPAKYKQALRDYYLENHYFDNNTTKWKLFAEDNKSFELNYIAFGLYDDNEITDFSCIIKNIETQEKQLLIFFDSGDNISVKINENIKIKTIRKGKVGGRWYLGNAVPGENEFGEKYESKKYEYLSNDGLLLYKTDTNENVIYIYKPEEKMIKFYSQSM